MRQWLRAASARVGIRLRFTGVICVAGTRSICIDREARAHITTRRSLVFLEPPDAGDLLDTYALGTAQPTSAVIEMSPDAIELSREQTEAGRVTISWLPRNPITLYSLYDHQDGWAPSAAFNGTTVCVEYECDMGTGTFTIDLVAPTFFDAAVLFPRPRWPRRLSERRLVRTALQQLKTPASLPRISDDGLRVTCDVRSPRIGERYLLVAFRKCGIADCEEWLKQTSFVGRIERALTGWAHALEITPPDSWNHAGPYRSARRSPLAIPWPSVAVRD